MDNFNMASKRCEPCEGNIPPLTAEAARVLLETLPGWELRENRLEKVFAFVNAIAWVSHRENHHPELTVGYKDCRVSYWTHAIRGLSENDFICAAKIERLREI